MMLVRQLLMVLGIARDSLRKGDAARRPSRRRFIPQLPGPLEERVVPTTLPIIGVFSGPGTPICLHVGRGAAGGWLVGRVVGRGFGVAESIF